tara:strand:+ start:188 stop:838 length:651 start_codon:yes stop_codon:yes gene_type:complete
MLTFPDMMQYVGQTINFAKRMDNHEHGGKCPKVQQWKAKYGWKSVRIKVLNFAKHEDLNNLERVCISAHKTLWPLGLNMTEGGDGIDPEVVRRSWTDPTVRARHTAGRKAAWADPQKRANIMAGRAASVRVAAANAANAQNSEAANTKRSATWEIKREARLAGLTGKAREQKLARLNRQRENHRRKAAAKRTQGLPASANEGPSRERGVSVSVDSD